MRNRLIGAKGKDKNKTGNVGNVNANMQTCKGINVVIDNVEIMLTSFCQYCVCAFVLIETLNRKTLQKRELRSAKETQLKG